MRQLPRRLGGAVALMSTFFLGAAVLAVPAQATTAERATRGSTATLAPSPDFNGIVALNNCSGSLVLWTTSKASDKALMLTNGHCTRFYGAHDVDVDVPLVRTVTLLNSDGTDRADVPTTTLVYGTMDGTDVSLYRLGLTYAQLTSKYGVQALTVSPQRAAANAGIVIISGFFKKAYRCHLNGYVFRLREGDWTWNHSLRYNENGCHMVHGTSGSPVLDATTRAVVGIHNTTNDSGQQCTLNNPCEIDRHGHVTVHQGRHYGEQTWWFTTCLGADRQLHLNKSGCLLPSPPSP